MDHSRDRRGEDKSVKGKDAIAQGLRPPLAGSQPLRLMKDKRKNRKFLLRAMAFCHLPMSTLQVVSITHRPERALGSAGNSQGSLDPPGEEPGQNLQPWVRSAPEICGPRLMGLLVGPWLK